MTTIRTATNTMVIGEDTPVSPEVLAMILHSLEAARNLPMDGTIVFHADFMDHWQEIRVGKDFVNFANGRHALIQNGALC